MKALTEMVFIGEIVLQSKIAQRAAERLKATRDNFDNIEVWCSIQSILMAAGIVSKFLWPHKKYAERGEKLRKLLNVDENSILYDRELRNHFEHYDERIETWFENTNSAVYRDKVIDSFNSIWGSKLTINHRSFDPITLTLSFRGDTLDLASVLNALEEIRQKCRPYALT